MIANFDATARFVVEKLGDRPFHLRGRLNYGALDSIMAAALQGFRPDDIQARFLKLRQNAAYDDAITYNTSDESVVEDRLALAFEALSS